MQDLQFHPDVFSEIKASYDWYQEKAKGLGDDFLNELENGYQAIIEFSGTWPKFAKSFQRFILSRFPFSIIYRADNDTIFIIAVMHNSRQPGYWLKRS